MPKIPDCNRYSLNPHLVCAVHPDGINGDRCLDFPLDSNAQFVVSCLFNSKLNLP